MFINIPHYFSFRHPAFRKEMSLWFPCLARYCRTKLPAPSTATLQQHPKAKNRRKLTFARSDSDLTDMSEIEMSLTPTPKATPRFDQIPKLRLLPRCNSPRHDCFEMTNFSDLTIPSTLGSAKNPGQGKGQGNRSIESTEYSGSQDRAFSGQDIQSCRGMSKKEKWHSGKKLRNSHSLPDQASHDSGLVKYSPLKKAIRAF